MRKLIIGGVIAILGMLVGYHFAAGVKGAPEAKWLELMTAIGTIGAVVVALAIALRDASWRRSTRRDEGEIVHAVVIYELTGLLDELVDMRCYLASVASIDETSTVSVPIPATPIIRFGETAAVSACERMLDRLSFMPDGKGRNVAAIIGRLPTLKAQCKLMMEDGMPFEAMAVAAIISESVDDVSTNARIVLGISATDLQQRIDAAIAETVP
ncbi:hypothetical protein D3C86_747640 [compost metagenome]|jgi:hypothetical protein